MKNPLGILVVSLLGNLLSLGAELEVREFTAKDGTVVKYRWSAPEKIEPGKTYPLVLFLHGAGERGDDNTAQLKHGVHSILTGMAKLDQPVFLIAPQCPKERWWTPVDMEKMRLSAAGQPNPLLEGVLALVDETTRTQPVDSKRFYLTGISMGGFATWDVLGRIPDKIAAAVPICGGGDSSLAATYKEVPIWAFHGEADPVVPVRTTQEMISALEKAGGKPKATYYPGVEHDSWTRTYDDPALFRWLLDQHRN
ncbi:MAG: dienelactone hydrolase family protein [Luteolibacter sp.]|uniref:carboxylesterase family protein n=1 Tax=Luteolibacter sp. TaxID=1962973 RepID=UPI003266B914